MRKHKLISTFLLCVAVFSILSILPFSASAEVQVVNEATQPYVLDKTHKVKLNITAENADYQAISNVGYSLYFLSDDLNAGSSTNVDDIDKAKLTRLDMPLTDDKGNTSITTDKQGVYLVSCTKLPENVVSGKDFIIKLPYSEEGKIWQYEINATPKLVINTLPDTITSTPPDTIESNPVKTGDEATAYTMPFLLGMSFMLISIVSLLQIKRKGVKK